MNKLNWQFPEDLMQRSLEIMRPHGAKGNEGLALWLGEAKGQVAEITHIVSISGPGFKTSPQYMSLSMRALAILTDLADQFGVYLVGQIHSHPGVFTDLSALDQAHGIRIPDYLSLVCPHYAQQSNTQLNDCGVHVFESNVYRRLSRAETERRIRVTSSRVAMLKCEVPA